jgi:phospholipid-binding lipoprotein MlaA
VAVTWRILRSPCWILAAALVVAGCATPPTDPAARAAFDEANDPLEPLNRHVFEFNRVLDGLLIKNVAEFYRTVVPEVVRDSIHNVIVNLNEPVVFANNLLQARIERGGTTFARFAVNSTLGVAGFFDVATKMGLKEQTGDFGQTLYSWGVDDGPYLVLPILGPSNPRDAVGFAVDSYGDPWGQLADGFGYWYLGLVRGAVNGVDLWSREMDNFDQLQKSAIDFYAELRTVFRQNRASVLRHGEPAPLPDLDTLYRDPAAPPPAVSQAAR